MGQCGTPKGRDEPSWQTIDGAFGGVKWQRAGENPKLSRGRKLWLPGFACFSLGGQLDWNEWEKTCRLDRGQTIGTMNMLSLGAAAMRPKLTFHGKVPI